MNVGFLIIARLKSTRLQRKVLLDVEGKPVLGHLVERLRGAKLINDIIICTSTNPQDNDIEKWAVSQDVKMFRGDEDDVLKRLSDACRKYSLDYILHITGDCPFVDPLYCDMVVEAFLENDADLITTFGLPHGAYIYGIKPSALDSVLKIKQDSDTEVWGRYFTDVDLFTIHSLPVEPKHNRPELRGTLDYPEDYAYIKKVFSALYEDGKIFTLDEWIKYHDAHPEIASINQDCEERYRKRWLGQSEITLKPRYRVNSAAIIGAGSIGRRHIKNLQALGITNIVALRSYKGHFKELPSEFGVQEMTSLDNLVASKPDVAIIANPTNLHLSTARSLLPFVKGIFIDKPLSHTLDHVSEFVAEVSKFKKVCFVGYNLQFHAGFKKISEFLQGDIPGKIISFQGNIGHWLPGWHPYENYLNTYPAKRELGGGGNAYVSS